MTFNMARIIGPSIAGLIIGVVGIAPALIFNAISFIPVLIALLRMDESQLHMAPPIMNNVSVNQRLMEGLSYSRRTPLVLSIFITVAVLGTFGYNFTIMLPLLATYVLHTNAAGFGTLGSFFGVGSVLSAVLTAYRSNVSMRRQLIGAGAFSLILGMLALVNVYALSALLLICLGFASITFATSSNTLLQLYVPDVLRGRIMGVYVLLFVGSTPIGSFIFGTLSDKLGVQVALIICSIICTVGVIGAGLYYYQTAKKKVTIEEPNLL
jgi:MFS family permease